MPLPKKQNTMDDRIFVKGDILKITNRTHAHGFEIGEEVVVVDYHANDRSYLVANNNELGGKWWVTSDEVRPVNHVVKYCNLCDEVTPHRIVHACSKCESHI